MLKAWIGLLGVVVGSGLTIAGQFFMHRLETAQKRDRDDRRKELLKQMLDNPGPDGWRKMSTMAGVIGAERDETARLLIELGARASETGNDVWAYLKDKPLPKAGK